MKRYIGIIILFFAAYSLQAQTENNSERLITQLKNGTAPGLQFAKNVTVATVKDQDNMEKRESLIAQIRKGTAPGMKFLPAPAVIPATATAKIQNTSNLPLASEQEIRKEQTKTVAVPPVIPNQEEKKQE
jgi:hypothetical protein